MTSILFSCGLVALGLSFLFKENLKRTLFYKELAFVKASENVNNSCK